MLRDNREAKRKKNGAYVAVVGLGGDVDSQVGGDMVSLGKRGHRALVPATGQAQIVVSLAADMVVPQVLVKHLGVVKVLET